MFGKKFEHKLETILGEGTYLQGELTSGGIIRLDGKFCGKINGGNVFVGKKAEVEAEIKCLDLTIGGKVKGNVSVRHFLEILPGGELIGDVKVVSLKVDSGASYQGNAEVKKQ